MSLLTASIQFIKIACLTTVAIYQTLAVAQPEFQHAPHWTEVSGSAIHYFSESTVHQSKLTKTGKRERSTDVIDLSGDLTGKILYHVTSDYDFVEGTLINTGHQVFSGTILGSQPVLLLDDDFIFTVNLNTGETNGEVFLIKRIVGKSAFCLLKVNGVGFDNAGNGLAEYNGKCRTKG